MVSGLRAFGRRAGGPRERKKQRDNNLASHDKALLEFSRNRQFDSVPSWVRYYQPEEDNSNGEGS